MNARPTSITVVSVILIILAAFSLFSVCITIAFMNLPQWNDPQIQKTVQDAMAANPLPLTVRVAWAVVGGLAFLISGIAMLRGRGWGRWLFVGYFVLAFILALATSRMKLMLIPGSIPQIVLIYLMFRPVANAYFNRGEATSDA